MNGLHLPTLSQKASDSMPPPSAPVSRPQPQPAITPQPFAVPATPQAVQTPSHADTGMSALAAERMVAIC